MSLINEALKRAEQQRRRKARSAGSPPPAQAGNVHADPHVRRRAALVLSAFALVAVAIVTWVSLPPSTGTRVPARGHAATPNRIGQKKTAEVAMKRVSSPLSAERRPPAEKALAQDPPAPAARVRESLAALGSYRPAAAPPAAAAPKPAPKPAKGAPDKASVPCPASSATAGSRTSRQQLVRGTQPPEAPALNPDDFQLGAILRSNDNSHALINNRLLAVGDRINGATIVEIGKYHVIIEKDGRRVTLRM